MAGYRERKAARVEHYRRFVHGWKLQTCTACSGSGYYDAGGSPDCGNCNGTGKTRQPPTQRAAAQKAQP